MTKNTAITKAFTAALVAASLGLSAGAATAADADIEAQIAALTEGEDLAKLEKSGAKVYRKCKACHEVSSEKNKVGPHQVAVIGRPAGVVEGFKYSKAMAESGLVWDVATLTDYLAAPKKYLKGTKMNFAGLKKEKDVKAVIYYLYKEGGVYEAGTN